MSTHVSSPALTAHVPPYVKINSATRKNQVSSLTGRVFLAFWPWYWCALYICRVASRSDHSDKRIISFEVILTVHRRYYVEIKCQLDAKDDIYCRSYCMLNMFRAILCPSSGAREYYTDGRCLLYTLELPMMGIVLSETCWASNKICNKYHLLHLVGILFPHRNFADLLRIALDTR